MTRQKPTLLFVEDAVDQEPCLLLPFELAGFSVDTATTGQAAVEAIRKKRYDAVVLDMMLPPGETAGDWNADNTEHGFMTGLRIMEKLQESPHPPPVWVLTGMPDTKLKRRAVSFPFVREYIMKDFSLRELAERIGAFLEMSRGIE